MVGVVCMSMYLKDYTDAVCFFAIRHSVCFLSYSNRPECLSLSLLGFSWWCQLHTGQVRGLRNTNGSMKNPDMKK